MVALNTFWLSSKDASNDTAENRPCPGLSGGIGGGGGWFGGVGEDGGENGGSATTLSIGATRDNSGCTVDATRDSCAIDARLERGTATGDGGRKGRGGENGGGLPGGCPGGGADGGGASRTENVRNAANPPEPLAT